MPPRRKQPARRASLRSQRYSPEEPVIEAMDGNDSVEDMDVSDGGGYFSDAMPDYPGSDAFGSGNEREDEADAEDDQQELAEEDEEDQQDELSSSPTPPPKPTKAKSSPAKPRLKIKLKLPGMIPSNATPTPSDEMPLRPGRKGHPKHADVESEDDEEDEDSTPSTTYAPTRMTQRQAALAGMVESSEHLMLEETVSKRKKHLNETELALKREETARKRKNLTAKKLEDEKIETINRLLKKQTRPRGKKGGPAAAVAAAVDADEEGEQEGEEAATPALPPPPPTLFRWVSSSKEDKPVLSFSIPPSLVPEAVGQQFSPPEPPPPPKSSPICDVSGCNRTRKYKLVKDPSRGGCGMEHLKALQVA